MSAVPPVRRSGILLRKLLTILAGLVLFVFLAGVLAVWALVAWALWWWLWPMFKGS